MKMCELFSFLDSNDEVLDLTADTRKIKKGSVFFLLPRAESKFTAYFEKSSEALAFVHSSIQHKHKGVFVEDVESVYFEALKSFYKDSVESLKIYGFTGTNGKTTTAFMLQSLLESYSVPTGLYGTVRNAFKENRLETDLTSPAAEDFYRFNHENFKKGMKVVICEVSSHALDQKRLSHRFLDGAGFTSFSQDHLDYHNTMEDYLDAKVKIQTESLKKGSFLILSPEVEALRKWSSGVLSLVGKYKFEILKRSSLGTEMNFSCGGRSLKGVLPLFGDYNTSNFAMALAMLCEHFGGEFFPDDRVFKNFVQIPGRMERVDLKNDSSAFIDYSHSPDSLEKALETLKQFSNGHKVISVFGCGGDRDRGKRPLMGAVSTKLADFSIATNDNPRGEDPLQILNKIKEGMSSGEFLVEPDREQAILKALEMSKNEPCFVLIAGKGHETTQETKGVKKHFSDLEEVLKFMKTQ